MPSKSIWGIQKNLLNIVDVLQLLQNTAAEYHFIKAYFQKKKISGENLSLWYEVAFPASFTALHNIFLVALPISSNHNFTKKLVLK